MNSTILTVVAKTITQAPIFLGLVTLVGLLLQKKKAHEIVDGVLKTIVGMVLLSTGTGLLTSTLTPLITKLNEVTGVTGVVPQNFAVYGEMLNQYTVAVVMAFLLGFIINLLLVKIVPWKICKNVYLTVHVALILSSFLCCALPAAFGWEIVSVPTIVTAGLLMGVYNTFSPVFSRLIMKDVTHDQFALGHQLQFGSALAAWFAGIVGDPNEDADKIKLPAGLSILKDITVAMAILMPCIFIGMGLVIGADAIQEMAGTTQWVVYLFLQGITFTAGFTIVLQGVRMFINQLLPAFKGISEKFAPGSIPALDCAIFYPYSGTGAMIGFLSCTAGAIIAMLITIAFHLPTVVFPSPNVCVFDGMLMGVFGNKKGGWKGAIAAGLLIGFLDHILIIFLYPMTGVMFGTGSTYSQSDYSLFWMPVMALLRAIGKLV
ncbi:PTS ascorbate transporter subunit IIC [Erysipelotrichaceae bacterium Oil+RF-744-GAM-WT-6]|uniref:Ascorbate-specific PTS system EIIC component n=1 Tax=Stecheria intestinalis TaxID=2606630 RepID=A0A7X2TG36_9FIRM|nr:PTS transporter subunit IIC [Stecheria intestinalis]MSS59434.1 PTS ascorbate transporter subunit IIC [Stecheria intestinalis]